MHELRTQHDHSENNELAEACFSGEITRMIDDFARPEWAEAHEKFAADVVAGLAWLGGGLWRTRPAEARPDAAKTSAPLTIAPSACSRGYPQYVRQ